jgi:hypothetical protein
MSYKWRPSASARREFAQKMNSDVEFANTFNAAKITTGTYNCPDYNCKDYSTLAGFIKGLKANGCPYTFNKVGCYFEFEKNLIKISWNYGNQKVTASVFKKQ